MEYSLQNLLDVSRSYYSDIDKATHRLRQTPPPSEGLKEICLCKESELDALKNDVVTVQILKEGGLSPTVYRIPEVSLADVLKKEKIEYDGVFLVKTLFITVLNAYLDFT